MAPADRVQVSQLPFITSEGLMSDEPHTVQREGGLDKDVVEKTVPVYITQ